MLHCSSTKLSLSKARHAARLAAFFIYPSLMGLDFSSRRRFEAEIEDSESDSRPVKKIRLSNTVFPSLQDLGLLAASTPSSGAIVACMALLRYRLAIPATCLEQWVDKTIDKLPRCFEEWISNKTSATLNELLWLLRYLLMLAECYDINHSISLSYPRRWHAVWDAMHSRLKDFQATASVREVVFWIMATMIKRQLHIPYPEQVLQVLKTRIHEEAPQNSPSPAEIALLGAYFSITGSQGLHSKKTAGQQKNEKWERDALSWAAKISFISGSNPSGDIGKIYHWEDALLFAVATYLHIPENNRVNHGSLQGGDKDPYPATPFGCQISCPWAWWALRLEEMNCEESHLLSGKMYVKARMLRMEAWKKLEEHQRTESEHRPFIVMAGDQRYKDVADILSNALHKALSKYENVMIDSNETSGILADDKRGIFLGQLLSICTMIVRLCTLVVLRQQDWKGDVVWGFLEQLLGQGVNTALAVLGNALPLVARMFSGFRTFEWRALHSLIESLAQCNTQLLQNTQVHTHREGMHLCLDDDFSRLRSCLKHILFYLNDASAARDSVRMATQARSQAVTSVQNVSFDEEFDMSGAGDTVNEEEELWGVASEKIKSSSSSARVVKYRAAQLLLLFANLTPVQVAHDVQDIIENTLQGEALGSDLSMQLVKVQVASAATAIRLSYHEAPQLVDVALNSLRSVLELGLGLWQHEKNERGANWRRLGFVSSELRTLCEALVSDHGLRTVSKSMDKAIKLFKFTLDCMSGANGKGCVPSRILTVQSHSALLLMRHSSQLIDAAVDISEQLLKKRQYDARLTGGKTLRLLLQSLDDPDLLFEAKLKPFLECSENESISSSMIIILADIATYCNKLEPKCLLLLSRMAAIPMVMACMDWIAMMLGYSDRWAYASWFLRQLCHMWLTEPELDVHALVGLRSLIAPSAEAAVNVDNFVPHVVPWLLPGIIWRNDAEALNQLASLMNVSCEELLANNLSVVFSSLLLLQSREVAKPPTSWVDLVALLRNNVLLSRYFENGEDAVLIPKMKGVYLEGIKFVVTAARESCPTIETLSPDKASEILAGFLKPNRLLPLSENQVASCLLAVQTLLDMARSPEHAFQALGSLEALLLLLQADITRPASLRCVVMMLIRLMHRSPVLHAKSCKLLDEVVNWVINSGETVSIEIFGSLLPSISAALVAAIEKQADRAGLASGMLMPRLPPSPLAALDHFDVEVRDMASSTYVERSTETHRSVLILLNRLLCNSDTLPASWRQNLACIDPIPRKYGMEQASVAVARHRQQLEPWQQLNHFASRAASMSHTGRELSLSVLRSLLYSGQFISLKDAEAIKRSSEVWNDSDLYWHSKCRHVATQALHPSIKAAAWNLAHLSGDLGDANLTNFAGELLALVGPLPENELAFGPNHVLEDGIEAKEGATSSSFKGLDTTGKGIIKTFATAIRLMSEYLIDEDVSVVKLTQDTLRMTLPLPPSIEAVRILPAEVSSIVKIFSNEAIEPPQKWVSNLLSDPELWDVARYPSFNDWVCRLACAFLERVSIS